jgi:hypothetical protein
LTGSPWTNTALELGMEEDIAMALFTVGFSKEMLVFARLLSNSFMDYTKKKWMIIDFDGIKLESRIYRKEHDKGIER